MNIRRMWINQPSTRDLFHDLHRTNVLAHDDTTGVSQVFFLSGDTTSQQVPRLALSPGWVYDKIGNPADFEKKGNTMDIENLTIKQIKEIAALAGCLTGAPVSAVEGAFTPHVGRICIIRTYASGVFMGKVVKQSGRMVELTDCRRLWTWKASESISLSAVAVNGVSGTGNKFPPATPEHTVLDALEIIPASDKCIQSINAVPDAKQS